MVKAPKDPPEPEPYGGDALLRECVEHALAPHLGRLSPVKLEVLRGYLIDFVTDHPAAEPLYTRLRSRPEAVQSTLIERSRQKRMAAAHVSSARPIAEAEAVPSRKTEVRPIAEVEAVPSRKTEVRPTSKVNAPRLMAARRKARPA